MSISKIVNLMKSYMTYHIWERYPNCLRKRFWKEHTFWTDGCFVLTNAIYNMDAVYQKFFKKHAGYPKFKNRHDSHKAYTTNFTNGNITVDFNRDNVKLLRNFSGQIKSATVSQVPSGKYYVLLLMGRNTKIQK